MSQQHDGTSPTVPRLTPVSPPYDEDVARLLSKWMPPDAGLEPLLLFRVLALHRDLAERIWPMAAGLLGKGLLAARDREVLICRVTARAGAEYEWGVHAAFYGASVGLDESTMAALAVGEPADPAFDAHTRMLVVAADELTETGTLTAQTWDQLRDTYDPAQIVEILLLCGWYRTLSTVITSTRLPLEPWAARFPRP